MSYERLEIDNVFGGAGSPNTSATGYGVDVGLRWMLDPNIEINPNVDYGTTSGGGVSFGEADGLRYSLRTRGYLTDNIAVSAEWGVFM